MRISSPALETIEQLKADGLRIGSTTGYTRPIMEELMPIAAARGYTPEITVCAGDLPAGRPSPLIMWHAMAQMGIWPAHTVAKVGRHPARHRRRSWPPAPGRWASAFGQHGRPFGGRTVLPLSEAERTKLREPAEAAHARRRRGLVIDLVADLPGAIELISKALKAGKRPGRR